MVDGFALAQSMPDLRETDLDRFCNFIYWFMTKEADSESVEKFRAKLWQPPVGMVADKRSPWSPEAETSSFSSVRASLGLSPDGAEKSA